jgi:hypothetical protein
MTIRRVIRERDEYPPDRSTERNRKDAALDEDGDDGIAKEAERVVLGLQNLRDNGNFDYDEGRALDDAIELLARLAGNDVQTSESRRLKGFANSLLEGRSPKRYDNREKKLKKFATDLKKRS